MQEANVFCRHCLFIPGMTLNRSPKGRRGRDRMVVGFTTTCAIRPITTNVVALNTPTIHSNLMCFVGTVYSYQE
jgi:hypothetical protein